MRNLRINVIARSGTTISYDILLEKMMIIIRRFEKPRKRNPRKRVKDENVDVQLKID